DLPVPRVHQLLPEGLAHPRRRAEDVIEPCAGNHLDDRAHPAALLAHEPSGGTGELHLAGGVRPVAELVLQPLDRERVPLPAGRTRGTRKQLNPPGACASTRNASDIGAEQNHLWPVSIHVPSPAGDAAVVFARTSEPPCFSVIAIPKIAPAFPSASAGS